MNTYPTLNMTIVCVHNENGTHYFFVDSGFPSSFSVNKKAISYIPRHTMGNNGDFYLGSPPPFMDISLLERLGGGKLAGFLGADFLSQGNLRLCSQRQQIEFQESEPEWRPDYCLPMSNWVVQLSCLDGGGDGVKSWFIDTGSYLSFRWHQKQRKHPQASPNWRFPSFMGTLQFDLYPHCPILFQQEEMASVTTAYIHGPPPPFAGMLGANFFYQFDAYFHRGKNQLWLKKLPAEAPVWVNPSTKHYTCGFQFHFEFHHDGTRSLVVSHHTHPRGDLPPVGTRFEVPHVDMSDLLAVNHIWEYLYPTNPAPVTIVVNGKSQEIAVVPMFY